MPIACHIQSDLSKARLIGDVAASWSAVPQLGDQSPDVEALRVRTVQAAEWAPGALGQRRRLPLVCVDSAGSSCLWLRSPNDEEPVLAATLRGATQDWGDNIPAGSVQRLVDAAAPGSAEAGGLLASLRKPVGKRAKPTVAPNGSPVIAAPLSLARLWLDELDARGVRVDLVVSLWHAMAMAWGTNGAGGQDVVAVLLNEPGERTVWCWARQGGVVVGGTILDERAGEAASEEAVPTTDPAERTAARLALDWLTWSAHLGVSPTSAVLVGSECAALSAKIAARWPTVALREHSHDDPVGQTILRASGAMSATAAMDPRRSLISLTQRPTRARRTQYRWAAAALILLAGAVGGLGYRMNRAAAGLSGLAAQAEAEARAMVQSLDDPKLLETPNLLKTLESAALKGATDEKPKGPPTPKPINEEIKRLGEILAKFEGVRLVQLSLDVRTPILLQLSVPDRRTGEEIRLALAQSPGTLRWKESAGAGTDQVVRLNGEWENR